MKYLKKGQCLCTKCGSILSLYHNSPFAGDRLAVKYLAKPSIPIQFSVSVFGNSIKAVYDAQQSDISDVNITLGNAVFHGSFLDSFKATITYRQNDTLRTEENLEVNSDHRVCPHCSKNQSLQYLLPHAGQYDTYLIGELGRPSVGKTQFARALSSSRFMLQRDSFLGAGDSFSLLTGRNQGNTGIAATPTSLSRSEIRTFLVTRRRAEPVLIYLIDIAGEYLLDAMSREQDRAILKRILTNYCSAFFAFYDPREIDSDQLKGYQLQRSKLDSGGRGREQWTDPLPHVREMYGSDTPPIAFILTGLDTLIDAGNAAGDGWVRIGQRKAFSSRGALAHTDIHAPITASSLRSRMLLSRAAMQNLGFGSDEMGRSDKNGWFVISSGRVDLVSKVVDINHAQGVVEPMAWFLSMAGIAEIKEG